MDPPQKHEKIKLVEINSYLTCYLCKGYLIDATTISECLHSFCRSCIIRFLQENCFCPVCEVIINKAKPCLKLDKTLQDIVYKLVPGLFVKEMYRRKEFYRERPALAPKVSPEERGEDTERTIFNPQDAISLSIEYISDDSAPGAIPALSAHHKSQGPAAAAAAASAAEETHDNPMKRYLQCPGMCRIEVLKKFVRNKYNVDTNLFHIEILYKRVPLPDHYTLIDIGYIYSWKRNEPMKFFFRITDINKVAERFDYFDGRASPEVVHKPARTPKVKKSEPVKQDKSEVAGSKPVKCERASPKTVKSEAGPKPVKSEMGPKLVKSEVGPKPVKSEASPKPVKSEVSPKPVKSESSPKPVKSEAPSPKPVKSEAPSPKPVKSEVGPKPVKSDLASPKPVKSEVSSPRPVKPLSVKKDKSCVKAVKADKDGVLLKPEITEEIKNKIQSEKGDIKNSVYTNITLNRADNVEIITKIQKVSNKEGQPIGLNIINHTVKKTNKVQNKVSDAKVVPSSSSDNNDKTKTEDDKDKEKEDLEKSNFLKSIELTAKSSLVEKKEAKVAAAPVVAASSSSAQKRKNSSPMKNEKHEKKAKIEKKPMKIIIQPKTIQNPSVRQMVTNVNHNVNNVSKIVEQTTTTTKTADLQSLIENCKIPASLSITVSEGGEGGARTPPSIPPVNNFIEILKLPDKESKDKEVKEKTVVKDKNRNIPTFQKIFEESIIKKSPEVPVKGKETKNTPLDLTSSNESAPKRKILEIASQLQKKTKIEQEKKEESLSKIAIPRLAPQRTLKPPKYDYSQNRSQNSQNSQNHQNSASLHSSSLGLNYTVSVGQKPNGETKRVTPGTSKTPTKPKNNGVSSPKNLSPSQLLEKYNLQNLAQLTASFNFNPTNFGALQHALFVKQMEHHSWLNQGPLMQYEKYLQSLSAQSKIMGNIKEN